MEIAFSPRDACCVGFPSKIWFYMLCLVKLQERLSMSNGGGEGGSQKREFHGKRKVRFCSLETLSNVAVQYIQSSGKTAHFYAIIAGRVDVKDIIRYTGEAEEMPFAYSLPRCPFSKEKRPAPNFSEVGEEPPDGHSPVWLPAFPKTKLCDQSEETNAGTIERIILSKENGSSLPSMKHSFTGGRLEILKSPKDVQDTTEAEVEGNLFFNRTSSVCGEGCVTCVSSFGVSNQVVRINHVPDKHMSNNHHIPVLEASAPLDKMNNKNRLGDSEDGRKKDGARTQRTLVRFKIRTTKKATCLAINWSFKEECLFQEGEESTVGRKSQKLKKSEEELTRKLSTQM